MKGDGHCPSPFYLGALFQVRLSFNVGWSLGQWVSGWFDRYI